MTCATARRLSTSWKFWAGLLLVVAVVMIEVLILTGPLSKGWTVVVVAAGVAGPLYDYGKKLRAKLLSH